MTVTKNTPPLGAYGTYVLKAPWDAESNKVYKCIGTKYTQEMVLAGNNPYELVYSPMGITQDIFNMDVQASVAIISLLATDGSRIMVPDTYIEKYPDQSSVVYNYTVMSIDIGPQPSTIDLSVCVADLKDTVSKYTGIASTNITVDVHTAVSNTSMSQTQYIAALNAQQNALANVQTKDQQIKSLQATVAQQNALIQQLASK